MPTIPPDPSHLGCPPCPGCGRHLCAELLLESPSRGAALVRIDMRPPHFSTAQTLVCVRCGAAITFDAGFRVRLATASEIAEASAADSLFAVLLSVLRRSNAAAMA